MSSCPVCQSPILDPNHCMTCGWLYVLDQQLSDNPPALEWVRERYKENRALKEKLSSKVDNPDHQSYKDLLLSEMQKLNDEFNRLESKVGAIVKERENKIIELLQAKLDEFALKLSLQLLSERPQVETRTKNETDEPAESIDSPEAGYRKKSSTIARNNTTQQSQYQTAVQDSQDSESKFDQMRQYLYLTPEEKQIIESYKKKNKKLLQQTIKASPTQDTIEKDRLGKTTKLFSQSNKGTYWIVLFQHSRYFLIPEYNFRINQYNFNSLENYFTCYGNWQNDESDLEVLKPATVKPLDQGGERWELVDQGVIQFTSS